MNNYAKLRELRNKAFPPKLGFEVDYYNIEQVKAENEILYREVSINDILRMLDKKNLGLSISCKGDIYTCADNGCFPSNVRNMDLSKPLEEQEDCCEKLVSLLSN